jgi:hypothetical protein
MGMMRYEENIETIRCPPLEHLRVLSKKLDFTFMPNDNGVNLTVYRNTRKEADKVFDKVKEKIKGYLAKTD